MPQEQAVVTISQSYRQSPGSARREPKGNPVTQHGMDPNSTTPLDILGWDMHKSVKLMKQSAWILTESRAGKSRKHRPEPQGRMSRLRRRTRSGVRRYRWSHHEPHGLRRNPTHGETPQPQERPRAKDGYRQRRHGARGATMRTVSTNETDAKKRRRARSGHSKRASARPSAKADKDSTKKERGMEWLTEREEHWREPRTLKDSRPPWGPPVNVPAATGREEKPQTEARSPSGRI